MATMLNELIRDMEERHKAIYGVAVDLRHLKDSIAIRYVYCDHCRYGPVVASRGEWDDCPHCGTKKWCYPDELEVD